MYDKYLISELYLGYVMVNFKDTKNNYLYFTLLRKVESNDIFFDLRYPSRLISNNVLDNNVSFTVYYVEPLSNYSNINIISKRMALKETIKYEDEFNEKILKKH